MKFFFRASLCNSRVADECPWCFKYPHIIPALPQDSVVGQFDLSPSCSDVVDDLRDDCSKKGRGGINAKGYEFNRP